MADAYVHGFPSCSCWVPSSFWGPGADSEADAIEHFLMSGANHSNTTPSTVLSSSPVPAPGDIDQPLHAAEPSVRLTPYDADLTDLVWRNPTTAVTATDTWIPEHPKPRASTPDTPMAFKPRAPEHPQPWATDPTESDSSADSPNSSASSSPFSSPSAPFSAPSTITATPALDAAGTASAAPATSDPPATHFDLCLVDGQTARGRRCWLLYLRPQDESDCSGTHTTLKRTRTSSHHGAPRVELHQQQRHYSSAAAQACGRVRLVRPGLSAQLADEVRGAMRQAFAAGVASYEAYARGQARGSRRFWEVQAEWAMRVLEILVERRVARHRDLKRLCHLRFWGVWCHTLSALTLEHTDPAILNESPP